MQNTPLNRLAPQIDPGINAVSTASNDTTTGPVPAAADARSAAVIALQKILGEGETVERSLDSSPGYRALPTRERAFARLLLLTSLRRLGEINAVIDRFMKQPLRPRLAGARHVMQIGACQLLFLDTPAHAAVSTAVDQVASDRVLRPLKGLVNAVLRRISEGRTSLLEDLDTDRINMPDWLWHRLCPVYGEITVRAISAANRREPVLDLTLKSPADKQEWANRLGAACLTSGSLRLEKAGRVEELPGFADGAWWVQDAASALPARLLGDVTDCLVIDLCAAPGGKSAQLIAAGARVTAVERSAGRTRRLRENLRRLSLDAKIVKADAATWRPKILADAVLLDAPCSATGTMRRHPEVPWTRQAEDIERLNKQQDELLDAACAMVKPGGRVVYTVCSLDPSEGEERVSALLARHPDMAREAVNAAALGAPAEAATADGDLRTLPCYWADTGGLDGFYAACLRRSS
ncbi:MAG: RsmB/NOP family class I SAM-dependent RNA methyltransferase [Alphaproteobacteria bacterium]|jgi:16S rRNA (cytosine967-C5)-methyltransferase|nr:RsmB/NOP family class I SAM-dependent RNA methyltransferase [Alphaproteobacteria bacterium]